MIRVAIDRVGEEIVGFRLSGHADYDESGKDIVCAGVSAVAIGTVNSLEALLNVHTSPQMRKGELRVRLPFIPDEERRGQAQLLLASMLVMIRSIQAEYGDYIHIQDHP